MFRVRPLQPQLSSSRGLWHPEVVSSPQLRNPRPQQHHSEQDDGVTCLQEYAVDEGVVCEGGYTKDVLLVLTLPHG